MKYIFLLILLSSIVLISLKASEFSYFLIEFSSLGWLTSFIAPTLLTLVITIGTSLFFYKKWLSNKTTRLTGSILIAVLGVSLYLSTNLPYVEDYSKEGIQMSLENNEVIKAISNENSDFNGLLMVASTSCPHCMAAALKLEVLQKRAPQRNLEVLLFTTSEDEVTNFKANSGAEDLNYRLTSDTEAVIELCEGRFPTFVYIKNGKVIHKWGNNDFGFPAYDWVESGLK